MTFYIPNAAEVKMLELMLAGNITARLFSNDVTVLDSSVAGDFTAVSGGGYSDKTLTGGSWVITPGDPSTAVYAQQTWTFTGPPAVSTVWGCVLIHAASGVIFPVEKFGAARTPAANGDIIRVTPTIRLRKQT